MKLPRALVAGVMLTVAVPVCAQSLGDLARKEQARRKALPPAVRTYTNEDLKKLPPVPDSASKSPEGPTKAPEGSTKAPEGPTKVADTAKPVGAKGEAAATPGDSAKDEKYWRGRINTAREEIRRNEMFHDALQTRINALTADFVGRDDPYQRAKIADDRQKALAELSRVKLEIAQSTQQIADIEEEARRAGVPSGWVR